MVEKLDESLSLFFNHKLAVSAFNHNVAVSAILCEKSQLKSCDNHGGLMTLPRNAMECAISHWQSAQAPVSSRLCAYCSSTRPARDVACPPCAGGQERWHGQQEPAWTTLDCYLGDVCV